MFKKSFFFASFLLLGGCAHHEVFSVLKSDTLYEKGLDYTKTAHIVNSFETKAILNATYLNSVDGEKYDDLYHNFLVGVYITEDNEKEEEKYLENEKYSLTLNGKIIDKKEKLENKHPLFEHIPLKNPYAKYYIISFLKEKNQYNLSLEYQHPTLGKVILDFQGE